MHVERFLVLFFLPILAAFGKASVCSAPRTVEDLNRMLGTAGTAEQTFDLTVTVDSLRFTPADPTLSVFDETGAITMMFRPLLATNLPVTAGDRLRVYGHIESKPRIGRRFANCDRLEFLGHGPAPIPREVTAEELASARYDNRVVRLSGVLRDVFTDEIDPLFTFLTIVSGPCAVHVAIPAVDDEGRNLLRRHLGGNVAVTGNCSLSTLGGRQNVGRIICLSGLEDVHIRDTKPVDIFDVATLEQLSGLSPQDVATRDRRRTCGQVLAVWDAEKALLQTQDGKIVRTEFAEQPVPAVGTFVEATGFPESNMFSLGLTRAIWRETPSWTVRHAKPLPLSGAQLNSTEDGAPGFDPLLLGTLACVNGRVSSVSTDGRHTVRLYLQDGSQLIAVDVSNVKALPPDLPGCHVSVTGVCVLDIDSWRPNAVFPRIREIFVVARSPADIQLLRRSPWWTPERLVIVLGVLFASLVGFALWNHQLKMAVAAKGRELEREIIARIGSDFKVAERTRLAVELHDSLSQTLTGVAMKINAANRALPPDGEVARKHLDLAAHTIASCRGELKNCLWDLRNNALEDKDMANAVRRIVTPHIGDAALSVRFASLRDRFTESTAHALLRIIRELATNAVRHGHATHVQIAGVTEGQTLRISVQDDGLGFDVDTAPGMELGHFGLEGIRERLREFDGRLDIESSPHTGTRAVVTFTIPQEIQA